jgi:hypothetical protein
MAEAIVGVDFGMAQANVDVVRLTRCFWNGSSNCRCCAVDSMFLEWLKQLLVLILEWLKQL